MDTTEKLLEFFRREFAIEERSGFRLASKIPDSHMKTRLRYYMRLSPDDRHMFTDCCAHWASANHGFVVGALRIDHTKHSFFEKWLAAGTRDPERFMRSVPILRAMVSQYKVDKARGVASRISEADFQFASNVRSIKAPELRRRSRNSLKRLGYFGVDQLGYFQCRLEAKEFNVHLDFGGRTAQLRYCVSRPEFAGVHRLSQFKFESALGLGHGDWDFIVEENVDEAFSVFEQVIEYSFRLPDRLRAAVG